MKIEELELGKWYTFVFNTGKTTELIPVKLIDKDQRLFLTNADRELILPENALLTDPFIISVPKGKDLKSRIVVGSEWYSYNYDTHKYELLKVTYIRSDAVFFRINGVEQYADINSLFIGDLYPKTYEVECKELDRIECDTPVEIIYKSEYYEQISMLCRSNGNI